MEHWLGKCVEFRLRVMLQSVQSLQCFRRNEYYKQTDELLK